MTATDARTALPPGSASASGLPSSLALPRLVVAGGNGRLGSAVVRRAQALGFPVVAIVSPSGGSAPLTAPRGTEVPRVAPRELPRLLMDADVYLSAATPRAETENLPQVARLGIPAVVATTGLDGEAERALREASLSVPVVADVNFSIGAHVLLRVARALGPLPEGYDVSITETHRREKRDHPSGTARALASALAPSGVTGWTAANGCRQEGQVEIASLRAGEMPGRHELLLAGPHEALRFEHWAFGREAFADGMLASARWLARPWTQRPSSGLYGLPDVLGMSANGGGR